MKMNNSGIGPSAYSLPLTLKMSSDGWFTLFDRVTNPMVVARWHSSYQIKSELRCLVTHRASARRELSMVTDEVSVYEQ